MLLTIRYYPVVCAGKDTCNDIFDLILSSNIDNWLDECPAPGPIQCPYWPAAWYSGEIADPVLVRLMEEMVPHSVSTGYANCFVFPAGCFDFVTIQWPPGSHYTLSVDSPANTTIDVELTTSKAMVPCGGACCVAAIIDTGYGPEFTKIVGTSGPCGPRDPNWFPPSQGPYQSYITGSEGCRPICTERQAPSFSTGISDDPHLFDLSANPTLVEDLIRFTGKAVTAIDIYDAQGKQVMHKVPEGNEIHIRELPGGIYYMQAHDENDRVKTVKILKQ